MPRLTEAIEPFEAIAADAVTALADAIQTLCYYQEAQGISAATVKAAQKCYRVLKPITAFYLGEDGPLIWDAPDWKFTKSKKEKE